MTGGNGFRKSPEQAGVWLEKAAAQNDPQGQHLLGVLYYSEGHTSPDPYKALELFWLARSNGVTDQQNLLGRVVDGLLPKRKTKTKAPIFDFDKPFESLDF